MKKNIDTLIDSAFSADKNRIPQQPSAPPPGLLEQLTATSVSGVEPVSQGATIGGAAISTTMKFILSSLVVGSCAVGSYLYLRPTVENSSSPIAPALITADTAANLLVDSTAQPKPVAKRIDSSRKSIRTTTILSPAIKPSTVSENDLDMPRTPPKTYPTDSIKVAISKKHK